ncbi:MAG: type II toxin-antitoxin system HicA family toxin [Verrucomicrobiota bacterium]|jgi:predicted RNA binding protein YcfA (HicA-like mRNA interferase family)
MRLASIMRCPRCLLKDRNPAQEQGCAPERENGSHSIWSNPHTGRKESIPRRNEIKKHLARSICRNLSVPDPPGD